MHAKQAYCSTKQRTLQSSQQWFSRLVEHTQCQILYTFIRIYAQYIFPFEVQLWAGKEGNVLTELISFWSIHAELFMRETEQAIFLLFITRETGSAHLATTNTGRLHLSSCDQFNMRLRWSYLQHVNRARQLGWMHASYMHINVWQFRVTLTTYVTTWLFIQIYQKVVCCKACLNKLIA